MRVHGNRIAEFREGNGHEKSDKLDAKIIWEYHNQYPDEFRHWKGDSRLKILYATFKEIQKLRVSTSNRTWANNDKTNAKTLKDLEKTEKNVNRELLKEVKKHKIGEWLLQIKGINSATAGGLIAYIENISKFDNISSLWSYLGLAVVNGKASKLTKGQESGFNTKARSLVLGIIGDSFIKQRTPIYRDIYDNTKEKELSRQDENKPKSLMHAHLRANRKMMKMFISHLWQEWRKLEGLPVTEPYVFDRLHHKHKIQPLLG